jgi:uncharacterized protein with PQ loop repeat
MYMKKNSFIEKAAYFVALAGPLSSIPQMWEIWMDRDAAGVSFVTWTLFMLTSLVWLSYAIVQKDRPLIISNALWVVVEAIIMVGAALYDVDWL